MYQRILVPLDGSTLAARALVPASRLAQALAVPLQGVSFATGLVADTVADEIASELAALGVGEIDVAFERAHTSVAESLLDHALTVPATLVAMSSYGADRTGAMLGSVADGYLVRGFGPVLLVGPACDLDAFCVGGLMLVPLDGSDTAEAVLPIVGEWTRTFGMNPELLSVVDPIVGDGSGADGPRDLYGETNVVRNAARELGAETDVTVDYDVLHGTDAARSIVERAQSERAALIALSTHGRTGLARLVAGSVAMSVLHRAPCPVLVYRPPKLV